MLNIGIRFKDAMQDCSHLGNRIGKLKIALNRNLQWHVLNWNDSRLQNKFFCKIVSKANNSYIC